MFAIGCRDLAVRLGNQERLSGGPIRAPFAVSEGRAGLRTSCPLRPLLRCWRSREGQWAPRFRLDVPVIPLDQLRCLSIIAHIDHGKSTLADRILEITGAVEMRDMRAQYLDSMDIERERGITIKAQNVRLNWKDHVISLIDTPGHVDFGYEVSRSLAACEGVILLVDASQGIEAQTLANCYLAMEDDLAIVAAVNKIDLPAADPDRVSEEIERVLGIAAEDVLRISAKSGEGVPELLDAVLEHIPPPKGDPDAPLQALIFDSYYDPYRGVVERGARVRRDDELGRAPAAPPGQLGLRRRGDRCPAPGTDSRREPRAG